MATDRKVVRGKPSKRRNADTMHERPSPAPVLKRIQEISRLSEVASEGMSFEDEIAVIREHNQLKQLIAAGKSVPSERIRALEKRLSVTRKASEEAVLQIKKMRSEAPILLLNGQRQREAQAAMARRYPGVAGNIVFQCPEPVRRWYFDFLGGDTTNDVNAPNVAGVTDGFVGWRNVPRILNSGTDQTIISLLWLNWHRIVPIDGTFSYWLAAPEVRLKLRYKLWGNGLWGTDARLKIKIFTWVSVGNAILEGYSDTLVNETKSAWGSERGTIDQWIPVGTNGMFRGIQNQPCWVVIQLQIKHWSENGGVWVDIDDFWYPSVNPDTDIALAD